MEAVVQEASAVCPGVVDRVFPLEQCDPLERVVLYPAPAQTPLVEHTLGKKILRGGVALLAAGILLKVHDKNPS